MDKQEPPHCSRCGKYLDHSPPNAFGWCATCEAYAQRGGPQPLQQPYHWPLLWYVGDQPGHLDPHTLSPGS